MKILGGHFDLDGKKNKINELENRINEPGFWDNISEANSISQKLSNLKNEVSEYDDLLSKVNSNIELIDIADDEMLNLLSDEFNIIQDTYKKYETKTLLDGEFDDKPCYLEIHPGAGGTEACDWADMLLRMYTMFLDKNGYSYEVIDKQPGDEAGIKSVLIRINGNYPYGYLKGEIGVHRLVRISPFNAAGKRQTSFAAVNVTPEFEDVADIEINEEDIRVDVFRSSGCGGQGVNTTDSAVRISHIPTGIVVSVQNERSQLRNKEIAMNILKSKLYQLEIEKRDKEINALKGNSNIDFGSQIRNYVLEPYSLVKDLRSDYESGNTSKVLDGDILPFMEAYLRMKR